MKPKGTATFGLAQGKARPNPGTFLKKQEKRGTVAAAKDVQVIPFKYEDKQKKPGIPSRDDKPVQGLQTTKNFITANAVETILQVPTLRGRPEPDYLNKADYGKVPAYLAEVKNEITRENDMIDAYVREQMGYEAMHEAQYEAMDEGEREALLDQLKAKWDAVNERYQRMTHMVKLDTVGKVKRKEAMESELRTLEEDIQKLERHGPVLVGP